jgi:UDP-N-acetylmuramate dehydrogenase
MKELADKLRELNLGAVKENEPLANHTTMKIGGPADILIEPSSIENLQKAIDLISKFNEKWTVIGRGSNMLVSDNGIDGVVIKLGAGMDDLEIQGTKVTVGGGMSLVNFAISISRKGLSGLEFAGGIPGSIGGAVYMNAGAHGSDISQILEKAFVLFEDGRLEWVPKDEMKFSYRTSLLQKERPGIVVAAVFQLQEGNRDEIVANLQKNKDYRKETQPYNFPSCGSVFRNPLPNYAGNLIEKSGLKGHRIGGAQISERHGNFIVNTGNATAADVLGIIQHVKDTVLDLHGVRMETEVEIIGRK